MDYSKYILNKPSEIEPFKKKMGEKAFFKYAFSIYEYFAKMDIGTIFDITKSVATNNTEIFIKIAGMYWIDFPCQIQFNKNLTQITRI